jgi:hypothetical protein
MVAERACELDPSLDLASESLVSRIEKVHDSASDAVLRAASPARQDALPYLALVFFGDGKAPLALSAGHASQVGDEILLHGLLSSENDVPAYDASRDSRHSAEIGTGERHMTRCGEDVT